MNAIRALIRNGRIEPIEPLSIPEGTEVLVLDNTPADSETILEDGPAAIDEWLGWYDTLEPLLFTPEEQQAWDESRQARKQWEHANAENRADRLRGQWR